MRKKDIRILNLFHCDHTSSHFDLEYVLTKHCLKAFLHLFAPVSAGLLHESMHIYLLIFTESFDRGR